MGQELGVASLVPLFQGLSWAAIHGLVGAAVSSEGLIREGSTPKLTHLQDSDPHGLLRR